MHETALYHRKFAPEPKISSLEQVHQALQRDAEVLMKKYGSEQPTRGSARFNVQLPRSPQHEKYSWHRAAKEGVGIEDATRQYNVEEESKAEKLQHDGRKFNMTTLRNLFKDIDKDDTGVITQRELIVALRKQKGLLEMFLLPSSGSPGGSPTSKSPTGSESGSVPFTSKQSWQDPVASAAGSTEVHRVKELLKEVDVDGSGCMEWDEFVGFFRRAGLLLEYKTQEARNRTTLCDLMDVQRKEEEVRIESISETHRNADDMVGVAAHCVTESHGHVFVSSPFSGRAAFSHGEAVSDDQHLPHINSPSQPKGLTAPNVETKRRISWRDKETGERSSVVG